MGEILNENLENLPADPGGSGGLGEEQGGAGAGSGWAGPSQDEWAALQDQNRRLQESVEGLATAFSQPEPNYSNDFDLSQLDLTDPYQAAWLTDQIVQQRLASVTPYVRNAAQDQGQRQMQELLGKHETDLKKDFPGGFDHKLAERAAFAFFDETGDAEASVEKAAKYAAEVRKQERDAAIEEYRAKNSRGSAFSDMGAGEAGVKAAPKLKTYDEVMDKYLSQTEV